VIQAQENHWLVKKNFDLTWIISPSFIVSFVVILLHLLNAAPDEVSPFSWLILVVFIDVSHVWSTLFRTYLNVEKRKLYAKELFLAPLFAYFVGVVLHSFGTIVFWRFLAYLAVFHFIRQQYGIYSLYYLKNFKNRVPLFNKVTIYGATVIPVLIWHCEGQQSFNWFLNGDFLFLPSPLMATFLKTFGAILYLSFFLKDVLVEKKSLLSATNLFLMGTILSWWCSIVWIKTDWAFSATNIVSHGVPYFALVYAKDMKQKEKLFWPKKAPVLMMFLMLFGIGYVEEASWAHFIWQENMSVFPSFLKGTSIGDSALLALLVPLLSLPQFTHYILDGFIWRNKT
jgi:hypothetical protein